MHGNRKQKGREYLSIYIILIKETCALSTGCHVTIEAGAFLDTCRHTIAFAFLFILKRFPNTLYLNWAFIHYDIRPIPKRPCKRPILNQVSSPSSSCTCDFDDEIPHTPSVVPIPVTSQPTINLFFTPSDYSTPPTRSIQSTSSFPIVIG